MAGSINLSLSQQFDITNGRLLSGGRLYFFAAGSTTPQNVYSDQALTIAYPNPIVLDSSGRIPAFYVADGSVRARLTNKAGVIQFDTDNILVVGPSSGGGGGSSVDATTIFQTGDVMWLDQSGTRAGWVRDNARTIGSATSGASERANADTSALYVWLWNTFDNTRCPVSTGRGVSAAADFAANKTIQLPDKRGRSPFGLDDMGNTAAGRLTGALFSGADTSITAGGLGGEPTHTLLQAEIPAIAPTITGTQTLAHTVSGSAVAKAVNGGLGSGTVASTPATSDAYPSATFAAVDNHVVDFHNATIGNIGSGGTHNNMPPFVLGTFYRKL